MRKTALSAINRTNSKESSSYSKASKIFGQMVFNRVAMKQYLHKDAFNGVMEAIKTGTRINRDIAEYVATGMKNWAIDNGATHYSHWFQPLTGATAEKHDAFFVMADDSRGFEDFGADELVQREPDASSFPSGGLRSTFEARGYTAWDPSSPAFIIDTGAGRTLCIPTIFLSYTGEALDTKSPLLKSLNLLEEAAKEVCKLFDPKVKRVTATLGIEQEYFVVDEALFDARPDLVLTGRTLLGHQPPRGQQLEDHYFGSIPERVFSFMVDFEQEALKLGIPLKTRHNEVAPAQFECAPNFEEVNLAVDHNQLLMDVMNRIARRHHLRVLFHEKPFAGVNGSGKHCNWSMVTDTGKNLLSPGKNPYNNLQFLTFFVCTIRAVLEHGDLLRASVASAGNDHRLGANEAPPAIISVFTGSYLETVLEHFEKGLNQPTLEADNHSIDVNIPVIPELHRDNTDRNRTSPFAFTGNKFEFRAVGSSANAAEPITILNTIVANELMNFKQAVEIQIAAGDSKDNAINTLIKQFIQESKRVIFNGNNYSSEWTVEATKRGLSNAKTTPEALDFLISESSKSVLSKHKIYSERELESRYEIKFENYVKKLQIEANVMVELIETHVLPAAYAEVQTLSQIAANLKALALKEEMTEIVTRVKSLMSPISALRDGLSKLSEARAKADQHQHIREQGFAYCNGIRPLLDQLRTQADALEYLVSDGRWPLVKYRELLFLR